MTLRTLNYGNYGIFLIMGNARFCPSTVFIDLRSQCSYHLYTWSLGGGGHVFVIESVFADSGSAF